MVLDVDSPRVRYHYQRGSELPDLVEQKISYNEPQEVAFMILDVFLVL